MQKYFIGREVLCLAKDFTQGNPAKVIFNFAMPMLIGNIFQQLYSTVDSIIVGNFEGKNALAAVNGSGSVQMLIIGVAFGFTAGMSVVLSQVYGARDFDKLKRTFSTGMIFVLVLATVLGALGFVVSKPVLMALDTPAEILTDSTRYLQIMFLGLPAMFLYNMYASVLRAVGDSKTPLYFLIIASIINIVLDYVFVAFFSWGVVGVAVATMIAQLVSGILCHIYIGRNVEIFSLGKGEWIFDKSILGAIINYGLPSAIQQSIISISFLAVQKFVNYFGTDMMAAFGVANRIESFVTMPMMQLAMALSMYAGQNIGAGQEKRAKDGVKATMIMQIIFCVAMIVILPLVAKPLINLFGLANDPRVIELGIMGIDFSVKFYVIFALFQTLNQFHRGVGDTMFSMVASLLMVFVRIPATYVMIYIIQLGEISVWAGMVIGWCTALLANSVRFLAGGWRGKAFVQKKAPAAEQ